MPIYEYECQNCGRRTEALQKLGDPPLTTCEVCQGELKKLISSPAFQFKGSGWYVTDYARKDAAGATKETKAETGDGSTSGGEKTSESKGKKAGEGGGTPSSPASGGGSED